MRIVEFFKDCLKYRNDLLALFMVPVIILLSVVGTPATPVQADEPYELISQRTATSKKFYLGTDAEGNPQYRYQGSIGNLHYLDSGGDWQDIDTSYSEADTGNFTAKFTKVPYLARIGNDSYRRIYPDRNDQSYWIDIGKPFPNMGTPEKVGNIWTWDFTNATIMVIMANDAVKLDFILKNDGVPTSITFPFDSQGITRQGGKLYHDGQIVGLLQAPTAIDDNGVEREVDVEWNGGSVTLSLNTDNLTFPIEVDPTFQIGASTDDAGIRDDNYVSATLTSVILGDESGYAWNNFLRFTSVNITQSATIDSANITFKANSGRTETICNIDIYAQDTGTPLTFDDYADYAARNWTTAHVEWNNLPAWSYDANYDSPSLTSIVQEVCDDYSITDLAFDFRDNGSDTNARRRAYSYDSSASDCPILNIEYTAGGVSVPTLSTNSATAVEETSCNASGNITATGGENPTVRGFIITPYAGGASTNTTESGNFSTGEFSLPITGLSEGTAYTINATANNSAGWGYSGNITTILTKPLEPTSLNATGGCLQISLAWNKAASADNTTITAKQNSAPADRADGTVIYSDTGNSYNHTVGAGEHWYYLATSMAIEAGLTSYSDVTASANATASTGEPSVTTSAATNVEETTATLNGEVTDVGCADNVTWWLFYDTDLTTPFSANTSGGPIVATTFSANLTSLNKGDKYAFYASANNTYGTVNGSTLYFMTKPDEPTAGTATGGTANISLGWTVGDGKDNTYVYAKQGSYPSAVGDGTLIYSSTGNSTVHTGLGNNETWYYRAWSHATENGTTVYSDNYTQMTATTAVGAPSITTDAASGVTDDDAQLNATLSDGGASCNVTFYWGTSDGGQTANWTYSYTYTSQSTGAVSHSITDNLTAETLYYTNTYAVNAGGSDWGTSVNFTTTAIPTYWTPPTQGSDNATDVILWHGDNLTIEDIQGTISVDMTDVSTAVDNFTDTVEVESAAWISYTLLLFIVLVGFWKRLLILKFAGGIGLLATAFNLWTTSHILSIIVGVSGIVIAGVAFSKDKK